jgi:hypothetical protein
VKHKPKATGAQLHTVLGDFAACLEKCCKADKEACFSEDGREFVHFHLSIWFRNLYMERHVDKEFLSSFL